MKLRNFFALVGAAALVASCAPKATPDPLAEALAAGELTTAEQLIEETLATATDEAEIAQLTWTRDSIKLVRRDFCRDSAYVVDYIKKYIPELSVEQIEEWEASGVIEYKVIDGKKCYFRNAGPNVFRVDEWAMEFKKELSDESSLDYVLLKQIPEICAAGGNGELAAPVRMKVRHSITLKESGAIVPGDTVRVWIPIPRMDVPRQKDFVALETSEAYFNDPTALHNTAYFERVITSAEDAAKPFFIEYEYTSYGQWYDMTKMAIEPYDTESALYKEYTAERFPHVMFTDRIKQITKEVVGDEQDPIKKAGLIFDYITAKYPWASAVNYSLIPNIPEYVMANSKGDCGQVGLLMITMSRCAGIPARWQSGLMFHPDNCNLHDWCELYFEGIGWVPCDPSFGRPSPLLESTGIGDKFFNTGIDSYRMIANLDYTRDYSPKRRFGRCDTVDSQTGEAETQRGMLFVGVDFSYSFRVLEYK